MENKSVKLDQFLSLPIEQLKKHTKFLKLEGLFFIILGFVAIAMPLMFTTAIEMFLAVLFIIGGVGGVIRAISVKNLPGRGISIILYLLFIVVGVFLIKRPMAGIMTLSVILAICFIISGAFKVAFALTMKRVKRWGWSLFDGLLSIALGGIVFAQWPYSAAWFIGLLVGIRFIFLGNAMIMIASGLQQSGDSTPSTESEINQ